MMAELIDNKVISTENISQCSTIDTIVFGYRRQAWALPRQR